MVSPKAAGWASSAYLAAIPGTKVDMTQFPEGGFPLHPVKRPPLRSLIIILIAFSLFIAACGARVANQNWPGIATGGDQVYVAYGAGVAAVDIANQQLQWTFPDELSQTLLFFAQPSVSGERIILGDFGASGGMFSPQATVTIYALGAGNSASAPPPLLWSRDDVATDRIIAPALQTDEQIFVGTADNHLYALDAASGDLQWEFPTGHSIWAQPAYEDGVVYVASLDNSIYALDAESGEMRWQTTLGGSIASHPVLSDGTLFVPSFDRQLHALDAASGNEEWTADAENWVWGSPALGDSMVFFGDIDGNIYAVSAQTGEPQWSVTANGAIQSSLLYDDGVVFVTSGQTDGDEEERVGELMALDAQDGSILWQRETDAPVFSAPVLVGDAVVVVYLDGQAAILNVFDREEGTVAWEFTLPTE